MYKTEDLKDLFSALALSQSEMPIAGLNQRNPFFKSAYADLAELVRVSRPVLTKNGICVSQIVLYDDNIKKEVLHTILAHKSGQFISSQMILNPQKTDPQSLASYMSYLKRYSYAAITGVVTSDEDDDGEQSMPRTQHNYPPAPKIEPIEVVTKEQHDILQQTLKNSPQLAQRILNQKGIKSFAEYPKANFLKEINRIQELVTAGEK